MLLRTRLFAVAAVLVGSASVASAQAWVDAPGELSLSLRSDYQSSSGVWHGSTLVTGLDASQLNSAISAAYTPVEHLSLGLTLNTNGASYNGPQTLPGNPGFALAHGSQDDGSFHWNVTDLDLEAAYQAYDGPVALTPTFRFRTPVTDYENRGYAASGTKLKEASLGLYLGRYGLGTDNLVLQLGYTFTFVEKEGGGGERTEAFRTNRSDVDLSLAYIVNEKFIVGAGAAFRYTHDGFDLEDYPQLDADDPLIEWHDPVLKAHYFAPAAVASYQFSRAVSLSARVAKVVWGRSASNPLMVGLTLGFSTNFLEE